MILFDWKKVNKTARGNSYTIMVIVELLTYNTCPINRKDMRYLLKQADYTGTSFLKNPEELLRYIHLYTPRQCAEYVAIASLRNLGDYFLSRKVSLNKDVVPPKLYQLISNNTLLNEDDKYIYFKFEEK